MAYGLEKSITYQPPLPGAPWARRTVRKDGKVVGTIIPLPDVHMWMFRAEGDGVQYLTGFTLDNLAVKIENYFK